MREFTAIIRYFYPRPPRGGRPFVLSGGIAARGFLSTPSARRATPCPWPPAPRQAHFYPRPPRGGRHDAIVEWVDGGRFLSTPSARRATPVRRRNIPHRKISIHALREEGDQVVQRSAFVQCIDFYPRPPRGGRLCILGEDGGRRKISIHALREEGDDQAGDPSDPRVDFYPRPPRGGRLGSEAAAATSYRVFLSTPSARRATWIPPTGGATIVEFLSTPSARRATYLITYAAKSLGISIHALREEGDQWGCHNKNSRGRFLSTPSARRATNRSCPARSM